MRRVCGAGSASALHSCIAILIHAYPSISLLFVLPAEGLRSLAPLTELAVLDLAQCHKVKSGLQALTGERGAVTMIHMWLTASPYTSI